MEREAARLHELGLRQAMPAGIQPRHPHGSQLASSKPCSVLNHNTSLFLSFLFSHLLRVYSGLEPLSFAPGTKSRGFPLVLLLPGLRYSKPNPQGGFNALLIGSLNSERKKNDPIPTKPNFMGWEQAFSSLFLRNWRDLMNFSRIIECLKLDTAIRITKSNPCPSPLSHIP